MKRRKLFAAPIKIIFHHLSVLPYKDNTHASLPVTPANSRSVPLWTMFERKSRLDSPMIFLKETLSK
jgi:hypothetical protein